MNAIDLTPFYRSSIGFDRLGSLINHALTSESTSSGYPPYNIEAFAENRYAITLAVAGFSKEELDIQVEKGVLTVKGNKALKDESTYLYQGIANRAFERKFNLAEYIEVTSADLSHGLLTVNLVQEIPESMKPKSIAINQASKTLEHKKEENTSKGNKAA